VVYAVSERLTTRVLQTVSLVSLAHGHAAVFLSSSRQEEFSGTTCSVEVKGGEPETTLQPGASQTSLQPGCLKHCTPPCH